MAIDPVCKMEVDEASAAYITHYRRETVYFCSEICKKSFDMDHSLDHRSWWRRLLDRIIEGNRRRLGDIPPGVLQGAERLTLPQKDVPLYKTGIKTDPVCSMEVHVGTAAATRRHRGRIYYFCSVACSNRFEENPGIYTGSMTDSAEGGSNRHG
jgi:YHS domain-containing protein